MEPSATRTHQTSCLTDHSTKQFTQENVWFASMRFPSCSNPGGHSLSTLAEDGRSVVVVIVIARRSASRKVGKCDPRKESRLAEAASQANTDPRGARRATFRSAPSVPVSLNFDATASLFRGTKKFSPLGLRPSQRLRGSLERRIFLPARRALRLPALESAHCSSTSPGAAMRPPEVVRIASTKAFTDQ